MGWWGFNHEIPFRRELDSLTIDVGYPAGDLNPGYFSSDVLTTYTGPSILLPKGVITVVFTDDSESDWSGYDKLVSLSVTKNSIVRNIPSNLYLYNGPVFNNGDFSICNEMYDLILTGNGECEITKFPDRLINLKIDYPKAVINVENFKIEGKFTFTGSELNVNTKKLVLGDSIDVGRSLVKLNGEDYKFEIDRMSDVTGSMDNIYLGFENKLPAKSLLTNITLYGVFGEIDFTDINKVGTITLFCIDSVIVKCHDVMRVNVSIDDSSDMREVLAIIESPNKVNVVADEGVEVLV